ncbi:MAG: hypothetical protein GF383_06245 [Candidatus Lokiarchaeota archaeon]|nr:hypothetical protein [Candidatus Lokiarchaeota archaeon]MBD3339605.1 hypothetical protein [Candidatus Lokiarchaeota archaeon]
MLFKSHAKAAKEVYLNGVEFGEKPMDPDFSSFLLERLKQKSFLNRRSFGYLGRNLDNLDGLDNLEYLNLSYNRICAEFDLNLKSLKSLHLDGNPMSTES